MTPQAVLLFPGAGSDRTHSSLLAIEEALTPLPVERADFPYRREGRRAPDRPPKLMACVRDEAAQLVVADGLAAAGLALIAYPLHPPGRPDRLRVEHFPRLNVPCLFVSGTRDPFGTPEELESHTAAIPGPVTHVWIEGGRHELKGADQRIVDALRAWITEISGVSR